MTTGTLKERQWVETTIGAKEGTIKVSNSLQILSRWESKSISATNPAPPRVSPSLCIDVMGYPPGSVMLTPVDF